MNQLILQQLFRVFELQQRSVQQVAVEETCYLHLQGENGDSLFPPKAGDHQS